MSNSTTLIREENNTWNEYLSSREVEKILDVGKDSLNRYCSDGKISYLRPNNGKRLFPKNAVLQFIHKNRYPSKDELSEGL